MFTPDSTVGKNPAVEERRLGKFVYGYDFLISTPPTAMKNLFGKIIPIKVDFDYASQCFNVTAFSEEFEPVEDGTPIPDYQVTIRVVGAGVKNPKRISYYVQFKIIERSALADLFS